jgi:hypothetical protein
MRMRVNRKKWLGMKMKMRAREKSMRREGRSAVIISLVRVDGVAVSLKRARLLLRRFSVMNLRRVYFQASVSQGLSNYAL